MRRLRVVLGATAVFVILAIPASASAPGWSRVPTANPLAPTGQLFGVSCPSAATCVAVGSFVDGSGTGVSLAERWDGTSWSRLSTPSPSGAVASALVGVSCTSSSACAAVGTYVDSSSARHPFAELWNGSTWGLRPVPEPPGSQGAIFNAVSCSSASSCTAVGGYIDSAGVPVTLAERWDGTAWTMQPTPNPSGASQFSTLSGVDCTAASDCVTVGGSDEGALAERWDGTSWTIQSTPSPGQFANLLSVSCVSSSACVAVGGDVDSSGLQVTLAEHWNGTNWTVRPTPKPTGSQFALLVSVSCSSSSGCTAVGTSSTSSFPFEGNAFSTMAERWDGQSWGLQATPNAARGGALNGVACPQASSCIAVGIGFDVSGTVITLGQAWDGANWSTQPTVSPRGARGATLAGVSCKSSSTCVAVGFASDPFGNPQGTLAEFWDGTAWRIVPTPNPAGAAHSGLAGVSCTSPSACVGVGTAFDSSGNPVGTIAERWDGARWSIQPTPTSDSPGAFLDGVSCTSPSACTAVGNSGAGVVMAERWNGKSWSIQRVAIPAGAPISSLFGVSCTSAKACTAVGATSDNGFSSLGTVAEQWNGTTWTIQPSPSSQSPNYFLAAVSCTSAHACSAVGNTDTGLLAERWDGTTWTLQAPVTPPDTEGNGDFFNSVSCSTPSACTAVGLVFGPGGPFTVAERWDGTQWTVQPTPGLPGAYDIGNPAVSCPTRSACTAVGSFTNNVPVVTNAGPNVTLAEQWNGNGRTVAAASNSLAARTTRPSPCAALAPVFARPRSTWFRARPSTRTAVASSWQIKAFSECRGT